MFQGFSFGYLSAQEVRQPGLTPLVLLEQKHF
jgi:hypothetical protein